MKSGEYYYEHMGKEEQKAYRAMLKGLTELSDAFPVPLLEGRVLTDIYFLLRLDHPEIFYTVTFSYRYYQDSTNIELVPSYLFTKDKIREHRNQLDARIRKLARGAEGLSESEKELYVHDFILNNVHYDKLKKEYSHEIIGSLCNGTAVCEGMAKGVKVLADALGLWCIIALSDNNPEKGIKYRHTWNIFRIGGTYYHVDATFDNTLSKSAGPRYDYFNLSDKQVYRDHEPVIHPVPACTDGDHFYYKEKKLSWTTAEEVQKRTAQAVKKGRTLIFQWRGGYLNRDIVSELFGIFSDEAAKKDKQALCSVNMSQAVFTVRFEAKEGNNVSEPEIEIPDEGNLEEG